MQQKTITFLFGKKGSKYEYNSQKLPEGLRHLPRTAQPLFETGQTSRSLQLLPRENIYQIKERQGNHWM